MILRIELLLWMNLLKSNRNLGKSRDRDQLSKKSKVIDFGNTSLFLQIICDEILEMHSFLIMMTLMEIIGNHSSSSLETSEFMSTYLKIHWTTVFVLN